MAPNDSERIPQRPQPDEGDAPRSERDPREPTATAPDSVEESVPEEAEHAGSQGPDAADPPLAAQKHDETHGPRDGGPETSDLAPDEAADVLETREEAREVKRERDERRDDADEIISLDGSD